MCDHLLDFKSWKHNDPKPIQGISYATATRHLRMLRRRIEGLMVISQKEGAPLEGRILLPLGPPMDREGNAPMHFPP